MVHWNSSYRSQETKLWATVKPLLLLLEVVVLKQLVLLVVVVVMVLVVVVVLEAAKMIGVGRRSPRIGERELETGIGFHH